jgi:hypothetical protein
LEYCAGNENLGNSNKVNGSTRGSFRYAAAFGWRLRGLQTSV